MTYGSALAPSTFFYKELIYVPISGQFDVRLCIAVHRLSRASFTVLSLTCGLLEVVDVGEAGGVSRRTFTAARRVCPTIVHSIWKINYILFSVQITTGTMRNITPRTGSTQASSLKSRVLIVFIAARAASSIIAYFASQGRQTRSRSWMVEQDRSVRVKRRLR